MGMKREKLATVFFAAVMALGMAGSAGAVDGVIEINQAKVLAAGGVPYTVGIGSYRLTGNLIPPANTTAIKAPFENAVNVTIDLNGFSIFGSGTGNTGVGINLFSNSGVTVENGSVSGFGSGVEVGNFGIVKNVHADLNGIGIEGGFYAVIEGSTANNSTGGGIGCVSSDGCVISGNTANGNAGNGIFCGGNGCLVSGNVVNGNNVGIDCVGSGCLITGNTIDNNSGDAIFASDGTTAYGGNVMNGDAGIKGGTSMAAKNTNSCGGSAC
jgi:parallel beta-helix repeat protein